MRVVAEVERGGFPYFFLLRLPKGQRGKKTSDSPNYRYLRFG